MATSITAEETVLGSNGHLELTRPTLGRRSVAEAMAAFALVLAGCGAIVTTPYDDALGAVGVASSSAS